MPPSASIKPRPGRTRRTWVVYQILQSIFTGEFQGGDRLIEEEVAAAIGVSRTPVREAFSELAGIGLIHIKPNQGAVVRPFGPMQIREIYHVRKLLEVEATRLAASVIELDSLRAMHEKILQYLTQPRSDTWSADAVEMDQQFHELIAGSCGSLRLAEEIGRYRNLVQTIRRVVGNTAQAQEVALVDHARIINALLARDAVAAVKAMTEHIDRGTEAAINTLFATPPAVSVTVTLPTAKAKFSSES